MRNLIKIILVGIIMFGGYLNQANAQVVINDVDPDPTADGSAVLELQSSTMGVLIPKVVLDNVSTAAPVTSPADGLLIYSEGGIAFDGFYFWANSQWNEVINDKRVFANEQFGELYEIITGGTATEVSLGTSGVWTGWKTAEEGILSNGITADTADAFADKIFISKYGLYTIQLALSVGGSQNQTITSSIFYTRGALETESRIQVYSKMGSQGALISGSSIGVIELFPGDELDLRFTSNSNNETLNIYSINYIVTKVGE